MTPNDGLFYDAFRASPIGIAVEDLEGRPLFVNPALCSMLGFTEEELRNKHCVDLSPPEDAQKDWALFQQLRAGYIDHYHLDKYFLRRDQSVIPGRLSISLLHHREAPLVVAMVEDLSETRAAAEQRKRQMAEHALSTLSRKLIEAHEEERTWIARELHDDVNQRLALMAVNLERLSQQLPSSAPELKQTVEEVRLQAENLGSDIQSLSRRLHPAKLEYLGLSATAAGFCNEVSRRHSVEVAFHSKDIPKQLALEISLSLFRVLQEALQNAIKRSGSQFFEVTLIDVSDEIHLVVRDSGIGFDPEQAIQGEGLGLTSMKERLKLIGGTLQIDSQLRRGTAIHARVPSIDSGSQGCVRLVH